LKVSSSAVANTNKHYDEIDSHEDRHRKGRPRVTSAAEDKFISVNCTSDCSINTSQHQLFRGDCVRPSWLNFCKETTTNKKRLAWAKKHKQRSSVTKRGSVDNRYCINVKLAQDSSQNCQ
jgi:hypothetical protein